MAGVSEKELERRLTEAGKKLEHPPHATDELLRILEDVENCLSMVEQSPSESMQLAVGPAMNALVKPELLRHQDKDVRLVVATCISEITRITAPEAPYDDALMMEFFGLIVESFESLHDIKSPSFARRVTILETVAKVRSCVVMLDLECDELILKMFKCFFANASKDHSENVSTSMQTIMTLVLDESEDISQQLLSVLLTSLRKEKKEESPAEHELAVNVVRRCAEKLRPYLTSEMSAEAFTSSNLQQEYHEVVFEICQHGSHMSLPIVANNAEHPLVEGTHAPSYVEGKDLKLSAQTASLQSVGKLAAVDEDLLKNEDKPVSDQKELTRSEDKQAPESDVNGHNTFPQKLSDSGNKDDGKENISQDTMSPTTNKASKGRRSVQSRRPTAISKPELKKSLDAKCLDSVMPTVQVEEARKSKKVEVSPEIAKPSNKTLGGSNTQTLSSSKRKRSRSGKETKEMGTINSLSQSNAEKEGLASARPNDDNICVDASTGHPKEDIAGLVNSSETKGEAAFISSTEQTSKEAEGSTSIAEAKTTDSLVASPKPNKNTNVLVSPSQSIKDNSGSPSRTRSAKEAAGLSSPAKSTSKDTAGLVSPNAKHVLPDDDDTGTDSSRAKRVRRPRTAGKRPGLKENSKLPGLTATERTSDGVAGIAVTESVMHGTNEQVEASKDLATKSSKRLKRKMEAADSTTPKLREKALSRSQKHVKEKDAKEKDSPDATQEDGSRPKKMQKVSSVPDSVEKSLSQAGESSKRTPRISAKKKSISGLEKTPTSGSNVEDELVGQKIKVWWPKDKQFYNGVVDSYDPKTRKHRISYSDGDVEILNLQKQRFELIDDNPMTEKSSTLVGSMKTPGDKLVKKRINKMEEESAVKQGTESSGRGGSQPLKRRKVSRLQYDNPDDNSDVMKNTSAGFSENQTSATVTVSNAPKDSNKPTSGRKGRQQKQDSENKKGRQMGAASTPTNENVKIKGAKGLKVATDQDKKGMSSDTGARSSDDEPLIAWKSRTRSE